MCKTLAQAILAFFSASYIPFVISVILPSVPYAWFAACLIIAILSCAATFVSNKPMLAGPSLAAIITVAPGLALANFTSTTIIAACLVAIATAVGMHRNLLQVISQPIKTGFKAGIGLMFIIVAISLLKIHDICPFLLITIIFWYNRNKLFIAPSICLIVSILYNDHISFNVSKNLFIYDFVWDYSLLPNIAILGMTMFIDGTITANTLNPGKEHRSLYLSTSSSVLMALPCAMYLETLIFSQQTKQLAAIINALLFIIIGFINVKIPGFLAASLLCKLGLMIIKDTAPKTWLNQPQVILIVLVVGLLKSFVYGLFLGILLDYIYERSHKRLVWLIVLFCGILISH